MKKLSLKQRSRDVRRALQHRSRRGVAVNHPLYIMQQGSGWADTNRWVRLAIRRGLNATIDRKTRRCIIVLPEIMNYSMHFEKTALIMQAIRRLAKVPRNIRKAYKLASVNFSHLKKISSSASLVLTAELSKWDDHCQQRLTQGDGWDPDIQDRFIELGFFDLFQNNPFSGEDRQSSSRIRHVRYIKGAPGGKEHKALKSSLKHIVGEDISKYTFLKSGIDEAITNVGHHAYPDVDSERDLRSCEGKHWYLTGAYNTVTRSLKVSFYDQGVGIPKTLPSSTIKERIASFLEKLPAVDRRKDEILLKAAMETGRTSTDEEDRGKGLSDFLTFINQRGDGYLSILSGHGLYKYSIEEGKIKEKSEHLALPIEGTLIIWRTTLN